MSFQKSHRAKALQSLVDAGPSTLSVDGQLQPPASLVKPRGDKKKKSRKSREGAGAGAGLAEGIKSAKGKGSGPSTAVEGEGKSEGEEEEEGEVERRDGEDVRMDEVDAASSAQAPPADDDDDDDDEMLIDTAPSGLGALSSAAPAPAPATTTTPSDPLFTALSDSAAAAASRGLKNEFRRVPIPPHRLTPLKKEWVNVYGPLVEMMGLQVRMNTKAKAVELKTSRHTQDTGAIQKGADFVKAFALGFNVNDALAILRLEDLYLDSFEVKDVKTLHGDHLSRAIGRVAGQDGKTKFTIENASRTRIVLADTHIHILGSVQNIKIARDAVVSLILGSPPGKVYAHLRTVGARMKQRF